MEEFKVFIDSNANFILMGTAFVLLALIVYWLNRQFEK